MLLESEKKYRLLFDNVNDAIFVHDAQARMLAVNLVACQWLGYTHAELMSMTVEQIVAPEELPHVLNQVARLLESGQLIFESVHQHQNHSRIPTEVSSRVITWQGQPAILSICRDIRERKQAEQEQREANCQLEAAVTRAQELAVQAQAANAAKSRFLAAMSHEIRTPLNAVLGFSQLLQRDTRLTLDQLQRVAIVNRSGEHLLALLNDILDFSKIEAGQQTLLASAFDLSALLRDLETMFRLQADAKQLTLHLEGLDDVERYLRADPRKLRQILINLLSNAVKFTATGGIWLRASTSPQGTAAVRLIVLIGDSGPGLEAEAIGRLFAAFEQGEAGIGSCSGTGLGLAISRQLARLMGGDLTVTSAPGQGSLFRLEVLAQLATESLVASRSEGSAVGLGLGDGDTPAAPADRTSAARPPALTREILDRLPAELRSQLREAALCGRQGQLRQTLQQVADPELRQQLLDLVAKFDYQPFLELLS
ncbi:MAG: PAS domain S-box protein [Planctomycetota bacterium]|nr:PAS domain S-box protein [Planctomycetota bacterium]